MPASGQGKVRNAVGTSGMLLPVETCSVATLRSRATVLWTLSLLPCARRLHGVTCLLRVLFSQVLCPQQPWWLEQASPGRRLGLLCP
jgi:hypothetical protein